MLLGVLLKFVAYYGLCCASLSLPVRGTTWTEPLKNSTYVRPLVLWHGLGDSASSPSMLKFIELVRGVHPGIFIHSVYIDEENAKDQRATFFGDLWDQLNLVNAQIRAIPELEYGFDALGFSQGGQFLRAYVEVYNDPPVANLITFGAQHMGVSDLPACRARDTLCRLVRIAARQGVYSSYVQSHVIQAQYFRDHARLPMYYAQNHFLTLINGEVEETRNETFKKNLVSLANFVMVRFSLEKSVVPSESSWFGSFAPPDQEDDAGLPWDEEKVLPAQQQPLYIEDWIGLRTLDESARLTFLTCEGEHMQISKECWLPVVTKYTGSPVPATLSASPPPSYPSPGISGLVVQS